MSRVFKDKVNHPDHYVYGGIETIDFINAKELGYELGNVVKYVSRAEHKGEPLEDLKKAQWYLNHKIEIIEKEISEAKAAALKLASTSFAEAYGTPEGKREEAIETLKICEERLIGKPAVILPQHQDEDDDAV